MTSIARDKLLFMLHKPVNVFEYKKNHFHLNIKKQIYGISIAGNSETVYKLVNSQNVNSVDKNGRTALHYAANYGKSHIVTKDEINFRT